MLHVLFQVFQVYQYFFMHHSNRLTYRHCIIIQHPEPIQDVIHFLFNFIVNMLDCLQNLFLFQILLTLWVRD